MDLFLLEINWFNKILYTNLFNLSINAKELINVNNG